MFERLDLAAVCPMVFAMCSGLKVEGTEVLGGTEDTHTGTRLAPRRRKKDLAVESLTRHLSQTEERGKRYVL